MRYPDSKSVVRLKNSCLNMNTKLRLYLLTNLKKTTNLQHIVLCTHAPDFNGEGSALHIASEACGLDSRKTKCSPHDIEIDILIIQLFSLLQRGVKFN